MTAKNETSTETPDEEAARLHRESGATITRLSDEAQAAQDALAAARAETARLDRAQWAAFSELQQRELVRRHEVARAVTQAGGQEYLERFQQESAEALADFRRELAATAWGGALIRWQVAVRKVHYWSEAQLNAFRTLNPEMTRPSYNGMVPVLTPEFVAELLTQVLNAEIMTGQGQFNAALADHQAKYVRGDISDPMPPAE